MLMMLFPGAANFRSEACRCNLKLADRILRQIQKRVPPTTSSLLSPPSMVILPPRPKPPAQLILIVLVLVGSKVGPGRFPGSESAEQEISSIQRDVLNRLRGDLALQH